MVQQRNLTISRMHYVGSPENEMEGTMSFASLTDVTAVAMDQWSMQHHACLMKRFLKTVILLLKCSEHFRSISMLLATEAAISYSYG
jgi:hypothetical protein